MSTTIERTGAHSSWLPVAQYPFKHHFLEVDGGRMHYIDEGEGDPIVFLHGIPTWSFIFRHLIRGLGGQNRCIAPDMIGFGLSDKPPVWSYSPLDQCMNLASLIDQLDLEPIDLVMHGYGAAIGMSYAVDHPDRIKRLVVMNGACWDVHGDPHVERIAKIASGIGGKMVLTNLTNWAKIVRRTFADRTRFSEAFERAIVGPTMKKEDRIGLWRSTKAYRSAGPFLDDVWHRRRQLADVPFQFIWGMKDPIFGEKYLNRWWHEFPLSPVERISDAGHYPMEEKPADVLTSLREFVESPVKASFLA